METSRLGIAITVLALVAMPVLAWMKRREARRMNNRALAADATQSATCAYLAGVTLAGLVIFAVWQIRWVDTVAALVAIPILIVEGRRAWRGEGCGCAESVRHNCGETMAVRAVRCWGNPAVLNRPHLHVVMPEFPEDPDACVAPACVRLPCCFPDCN